MLVVLGLLAAGGTAFALKVRTSGGPAASAAEGGKGKKGGGAGRRAPVAVATVEARDVPIELEGLGTVTPLATVTVRSQVDGRLERVAFREGQKVRRGDLLAQIDPRPFRVQLQQVEATLARDRSLLDSAKLALSRSTALHAQKLVPQQEVDDAAAAVAQRDATVRMDGAQVDGARLQLEYARIVAPIDGVTGLRQLDAGNLVRAGDAGSLVVLTQLDPIAVVFALPQDALAEVPPAHAEGLVVDVYGRDGDHKLGSGTLSVIDNQISAATATIRLKATLANPAAALWPNQFVKARLRVATRRGALVVPAAAIQRGPKQAFVYVVAKGEKGERAEARPVEVERIEGALAIVRKGLSAGERVVTDGQGQLEAGAEVDVRAPEGDPGADRGGGKKAHR